MVGGPLWHTTVVILACSYYCYFHYWTRIFFFFITNKKGVFCIESKESIESVDSNFHKNFDSLVSLFYYIHISYKEIFFKKINSLKKLKELLLSPPPPPTQSIPWIFFIWISKHNFNRFFWFEQQKVPHLFLCCFCIWLQCIFFHSYSILCYNVCIFRTTPLIPAERVETAEMVLMLGSNT